ncbi:dynamin family protein [Gilvimarinus chinensis]|uniref:dynamin family protein n=1 Tax=Gilvimarinus chinensis TaxID=396005 RepID=UPI00037F42C4|nr:dynamin family protein [Gilvimarinus chinensis]
MDIKALHRQMAQFNTWKRELGQRLDAFNQWSQNHQLVTADALRYLNRARALIDGEHFTIACVGEFSRGKTELINALLYSEQTGRLLPSQPGRTTMCPTEIFWDPNQPRNCVRLLPIETRRSSASMQSFKRIPQNWFTIEFDPLQHESIAHAIGQVSANKKVTQTEAERLGFDLSTLSVHKTTGLVEIPTWRHALINLDHPLLREGLRIVDTPGLNALGNEPELTLKTLPEAHAILFLLAADSGVSASDMTIWRDHIHSLRDSKGTAVLALLNKIDTLWDELTPPEQVAANIERVRLETAQLLEMSADHVLPLSAKQALVAKTCKRTHALLRSNFPELERHLAECILRSQQQIKNHRLIRNSQDMIGSTLQSLNRQVSDNDIELATLRDSRDESVEAEMIRQRERIRSAHHRYHKQSLSLRTSQRMLNNQKTSLHAPIADDKLQRLLDEAYKNLSGSWTTLGLSRAIGGFFDDVDTCINQLLREIERANKVLHSIYERPEHGLEGSLARKHELNITAERRRLRNLEASAERLRHSFNSVMAPKKTLINRFVGTLVKEVKELFRELQLTIQHWLEDALTPLIHHNQHQKQLLEHQMMRLSDMRSKTLNHSEQLNALETSLRKLILARDELEPLLPETSSHIVQPQLPKAQVVSLQSVKQQVQR